MKNKKLNGRLFNRGILHATTVSNIKSKTGLKLFNRNVLKREFKKERVIRLISKSKKMKNGLDLNLIKQKLLINI